MKWIFSILLLLVSSTGFGQGFTYSYVDPCSKKLKVINIPNANSTVTVNYLGYVNTFTKDDFDNGSFAGWVGDLSTKYSSAPCDEIKTKTQVSQNTILTQNIISTLSSVMSVSTMTVASSIGSMSAGGLSNSVDNSSSGDNGKSSGKGSGKNDQNNTQSGTNTTENGGNNTQSGTSTGNIGQNNSNIGQNNPNSGSNPPKNEPQTPKNEPQTGNNPQTPQTGGNTGNSGGNTGNSGGNTGSNTGQNGGNNGNTENSGGNTGNSGNSGGNSGNSGGNSGNSGGNSGNSGGSGGGNGTAEPKNDPATPKTDEKSGGNGGTTNSVANAAESSSSGGSSSSSGGKPSSKTTAKTGSIVGTGDIVVIRSAEDNSNQFKATMSMTKSNTDNSRSKGALLNFTTTVNNSNLTLYTALTNKKKTNTAIFANSSMIDLDRNFFNTTTALESHKFNRVSLMGGANFTIGDLDGEMFTNLSAVGGGFYMFNVGKKVSANVLMLAVYSPFTKFYEGRWWSSGVLLVPFSSWDYSISKNFKFNVSFSGTYQYSDKFLNYQILTGGKIML
jgi:hypothetical protein